MNLADMLTPAVRDRLHVGLTQRAFEILCANLERFGNHLGDAHKAALMELVGGFTLLAFGVKKGRLAYPLATGLGKTQSIVAWCSALHELGYQDVSIAVAANKVEALCQLKRDLLANGVPAEWIGLLHSYGDAASEPKTDDNDERPIMLVTHQRIKCGNLRQFHCYRGEPRNLLIWDEALLVSDSRAISKRLMQKALGWITPDLGEEHALVRYFGEALAILDAELKRQAQGGKPRAVQAPPLAWDVVERYKARLGEQLTTQPLRDFLEVCQEQLRVVDTGQGGGPRRCSTFAGHTTSLPTSKSSPSRRSTKPTRDCSSPM